MTDPTTPATQPSPPRRRRSRRAARRRRRIAAAVSVAVLLALAVATSSVLRRGAGADAGTQAGTRDRTGDAYLSPAATLSRPVYRYSVVPGGVFSADEVRRAIDVDPVVAAHYVGVDLARLRVERLDAPRWAHVSYRVDNAVYWTRTQVLLRAGEVVLTDGERMIRARCGNSVSVVSMQPLHPDEPAVDEFDRLGDPVLLAALPPAELSTPLPGSSPDGLLGIPSVDFPVFIAVDPEDPKDEDPSEDPPGDDPPIDDPDDDPPPPSGPPPGDPPLPVPEPSTLLLVGVGAAGGLWRHLRNRRVQE